MALALVIAGAASLISSGIQAYKGNKQRKEAKALLDQKQPDRVLPPSMKKALEQQRYLANADAPGLSAAKAMANQRLAQQFEGGLDVSRGANSAQGMLERQYAGLTDADRQREVQNQQYKFQQQKELINQQNRVGQVEWDIETANKMDPFYRDQLRGQALETAGNANMQGAFNNLAGSTVGLASAAAALGDCGENGGGLFGGLFGGGNESGGGLFGGGGMLGTGIGQGWDRARIWDAKRASRAAAAGGMGGGMGGGTRKERHRDDV